ncbi:hypothetical protein NM688_g2882 [Phlebia brevispora]|uniref:Uncharacterized protein n=1 Tax=Phlebia brevispora TaxID=194682 RepID=A0ACC1T779_9APHY|nr:hypothetical protein NM688_g2882 [Phlebia brevispora]
MELDLQAFRNAQAERYTHVAAIVLVMYEYVLQFRYEVDFFLEEEMVAWNLAFSVCNRYMLWTAMAAGVALLTVHMILLLRISAMYGGTRTVLCICTALFLLETGCLLFLSLGHMEEILVVNEPAPAVYICADGDPREGKPWVAYQWMVVLGMEFILVALAIYKRLTYRGRYGGSFMRALANGSIVYFTVILVILASNQVFWFLNNYTLNEVATPFAFTIPNVLANRLMVMIRKHYYTQTHENSVRATTSPQVLQLPDTSMASEYAEGNPLSMTIVLNDTNLPEEKALDYRYEIHDFAH